jgi:hypothetical protein
MGHPLQKLGAALTNLLDDDQFNNIEQYLIHAWEHENRRATPPGYEMVPEGTMAVLRDLEWTFDGDWCNVCESHKNSGHADDCKLAAILTRHRATPKPQETPNAQG